MKLLLRAGMLMVSLLLVLCVSGGVRAKGPPDNRVEALELATVTREVDLTSPLVKQKVTMVLENKGSKAVTSVLYTVEPQLEDKVAFISAQVSLVILNRAHLGGTGA